jgi:hypothetical protein
VDSRVRRSRRRMERESWQNKKCDLFFLLLLVLVRGRGRGSCRFINCTSRFREAVECRLRSFGGTQFVRTSTAVRCRAWEKGMGEWDSKS